MKSFYFLIIPILLIGACQQSTEKEDKNDTETANHLGALKHTFPVSELARERFDKGLLLLHSFEYEDARTAFEEAIKADTTEVMAYWGAAMTYYKALWGLQDVEGGQSVMQRLGESKEQRLERAENGLERDFWSGVELLYSEGELKLRNKKYTDHMASLYEKYPGNEEVAAFYALGLMWSGDLGADSEEALLSARVSQGILEENPEHPGALHYTIHAYDNPVYAKEAKIAADRYARVAPDAQHALHMPSHIYLALGMWDDVVSSNEASYAASVRKMEARGLSEGARGYHSYSWLHYGYLQQGRFEKANELLEDMLLYVPRDPDQGARSYLVMMQNNQFGESGMLPKADHDVDVSDLGINTKAAHRYFLSRCAYEDDNPLDISRQIDLLREEIADARLLVGEDGVAMCSAGTTRYAPNENSIKVAEVLLLQIQSLEAAQKKDWTAFESHLQEATTLESSTDYSYGPPDIPHPSYEQYGYWLLNKNRPEEALVQFQASLERAPRRAKAMRGKLEALLDLERVEEAEAVSSELKEIWAQADDEVRDMIASI